MPYQFRYDEEPGRRRVCEHCGDPIDEDEVFIAELETRPHPEHIQVIEFAYFIYHVGCYEDVQ